MKSWVKPFVHKNRFYEAKFLKRPLRSGLDVVVNFKGHTLRLHNPDLAEGALLERVRGEIDKVLVARA